MQVFDKSNSGQVTSSGTAVATFSAQPCRLLYLQAASTNTGTVTICQPSGTAGLVRNAGEDFPPIWIADMSDLAYITSVSGDKINWLALR